MKLVYLKNDKKEIVFNEVVASDKARALKLKLMADYKYNGCKGYIVNLDAFEGVFSVKVEKPKEKKK